MAKYRLAAFDFDGTLADTFDWFKSVLDDVADRFGFERIGAAELESLRGEEPRAILRRLGIPMWKLPRIASHMRSLAATQIDRIPLFDGARPMLRSLHESGVIVCVVSSNAEANIRRVLGDETAALVSHFDCGASLFGKPAKLKQVLRAAGVAPSDALYVGDEIRDADASRQVGMAFGAVTWGYGRAEALAACAPQELFESFEDLARKVGGA